MHYISRFLFPHNHLSGIIDISYLSMGQMVNDLFYGRTNLFLILDNFQLNSYKDWFDHDWYDKIRDYEWDPSLNKRNELKKRDVKTVTDSVPLRFDFLGYPYIKCLFICFFWGVSCATSFQLKH